MKHGSVVLLLAILLCANVAFIYSLREIAVGAATQKVDFNYISKMADIGERLKGDGDFIEMKKRYEAIRGSIVEERARRYLDALFGHSGPPTARSP